MSSIAAGNASVICDESIITDYDTTLVAISIGICLLGLVYNFWGYRFFKAAMFLSGLIFGASMVYLMCREEKFFQKEVTQEVAAGIAAGIGLLCGLITMLVLYVGLFLQGFFLGGLIAIAGVVTLQNFYNPASVWIPVGIIFGTGVLFAVITLKYEKKCVMLSTAIMGSALITVCVDYFLEHFQLLEYIWEALMATPSQIVCWYTWMIWAIWPALAVSGFLLQWKVTANGYDYANERRLNKHVRTRLVADGRRPSDNARAAHLTEVTIQGHGLLNNGPPELEHSLLQQSFVDPSVEGASGRNLNYNTDTLPPSYFECVQLGFGDPVGAGDTVVHTDTGAYVSRPPLITEQIADITQGDLLQAMSSGAGYSVEYPVSDNTQHMDAPVPQDDSNFQELETGLSQGGSDAQQSSNHGHRSHGRKFRVSPAFNSSCSHQSNEVVESDTESLLSHPSKSSGYKEAINAHAERLRVAERRRSSKQVTGALQSSNVTQ